MIILDEEVEAHNRLIELNLRLEARAVERKAQLCQRGFLPDPCNIQVERQWDHRMHNGDSAVLGNSGTNENGLNLTFINNATSNADHGHPITAGPLPTVNHPSTDRPAHEFLYESQCGGNVVKAHDSVDESGIVSGNNNDSDDDDISENNDNVDDDDSMSVESEASIDVVSSGDEGSMDVAINENKNNDVATYCGGDKGYFHQEQHRNVVYDNEDESFDAEQMDDQRDH
ncbi:unnamed protein product [Gongylonema pulchrum]|uniref:Na_trans_cytopl domain-containing protein n=1 Tax=Gongylonema pulchrum TaxID=637853 RepID=A0A183E335_9BILA|nr:unnamed protein product [Gongylonema pulchrum]